MDCGELGGGIRVVRDGELVIVEEVIGDVLVAGRLFDHGDDNRVEVIYGCFCC